MVFHIEKSKRKTAITAGVIGNIMEWYDFALYGYMASILSQLFFPGDNHIASLLATYGVFAAGFIMRPLGSVVFGWMGDRIGRSKVMFISVAMMAFPTFALGLLPTFGTVGIAAPILLVLIRLIQGLSVGGEFSSSVTYLVETAPRGKRGLSGSWANVGSMGGMLLGSGLATATTNLLSTELVHEWGWRLPFLFGGILGIVAIWLRSHITRSSHFHKHNSEREATSPLKEAFTDNLQETIQAIMFASVYGILFYISLVYLPNWIEEYTDYPLEQAMTWNTIATALLLILIPLAGWVSDKYIRRSHVLVLSLLIFATLSLPFIHWLIDPNTIRIALVQLVFALLIAVLCGVAPSLFVELFPSKDRLSGYSVAYNLGLGVVGGTTPLLSTWLISVTDSEFTLGWLMVIASIIGIGALIWIKDQSREPLQ